MEGQVTLNVSKEEYFKIMSSIYAFQIAKGVIDEELMDLTAKLTVQGVTFLTDEDIDNLKVKVNQ